MKLPLLLLTLFALQAHAQIIYTDVVPDAVYNVNGDTCRLDLNNDATTDFYIRYYKKPGNACSSCTVGPPDLHPSWVKIDALGLNAVDTVDASGGLTAEAAELPPLTVIDGTLNWLDAEDLILSSMSSYCSGVICAPLNGNWPWSDGASVDEPRFLALRSSHDGSTYYGWARLTIPDNPLVVASFTLKDYAYNSVPDEMILAGEGADINTGTARMTHSSVQVTPNPFNSTLSVSIGGESAGNVTCTVRALTGTALVTRTIPGSGGRSSFTLDLASLASGIYLLDAVIDGERIVRKVMKD